MKPFSIVTRKLPNFLLPAILLGTAAYPASEKNPALASERNPGDIRSDTRIDTLRLSLRAAIVKASENGYAAQSGRSESAEAQARVDQARAALLPHVGATATDAVRSFNLATMGLSFTIPGAKPLPNLVGPFQVQDARVGGRFTLFDAAAWTHWKSSQADAERGAWSEKAASEDAAISAAAAYLALARARALLEFKRAELELANKLEALTRAQQAAGAATRLEIIRAEGQSSSARSGVAAASGQEEQARYILMQSLGLAITAYPLLSDSLYLPESDPTSLPDSAWNGVVAQIPEVAVADRKAEAARREADALDKEWLPTLGMEGDYGLSGRKLNGNAELTGDISLQASWSLWDGGGRQGRAAAAREKARQADIKLREARSRAEESMRYARAALISFRQQATNGMERVRLAEEEVRLAEERFRSGGSGNLEVISAQGTVSLAHEALLESLHGYARARLEFLRATHRYSEI